jgi:hypothetical protein
MVQALFRDEHQLVTSGSLPQIQNPRNILQSEPSSCRIHGIASAHRMARRWDGLTWDHSMRRNLLAPHRLRHLPHEGLSSRACQSVSLTMACRTVRYREEALVDTMKAADMVLWCHTLKNTSLRYTR